MTAREVAKALRAEADRIENPPVYAPAAHEPWHAHAEDFPFEVASDGTSVSLPHQCDDWVIADGPRAYVALRLAEFINRAQVALEQIRTMEEA